MNLTRTKLNKSSLSRAPAIIIIATISQILFNFVACNSDPLIDINNPIKSAAADEVKLLPGLEAIDSLSSLKQYSGYLPTSSGAGNCSETNNGAGFLHYWLFESQELPGENYFAHKPSPLIIWTGGKPGCSSLVGLLKEIGPFGLDPSGKLIVNSYSWNENNHLLFLEKQSGIGFSYGAEKQSTLLENENENANAIEDDATKLIDGSRNALMNFFKKFPHLKQSPIFLAGQQAAGIYLPKLMLALMEADPQINLRGLILGNAMLNGRLNQEAAVCIAYHHLLIDTLNWREIGAHCCEGQIPFRDLCHFRQPTRDCRRSLEKVSKIFAHSYNGLNPENLYNFCANYAEEVMLPIDHRPAICRFQDGEKDVTAGKYEGLGEYLDRSDVRRALHIPEAFDESFEACQERLTIPLSYESLNYEPISELGHLLEFGAKNASAFLYNGDIDLMHNFMGNKWFIEDLKRPEVEEHQHYICNDRLAGFKVVYDRLMFASVNGAGESPSYERPKETRTALNEFLRRFV